MSREANETNKKQTFYLYSPY